MTMSSRKESDQSTYPWLITAALCMAGAAVSLYLAHLHWAVHTDFNYTSFCAYSRAVNCETVAESIFSVFFRVPVAVWGIWAYLLMAALALEGIACKTEGRRIWMLVYIMAVLFCLASLVLLIISKVYIRSVCILCLVSYGLNFALLAVAMHFRSKWKIRLWAGVVDGFRFLWEKRSLTFPLGLLFLAAALILPALYPQYWSAQKAVPSYLFPSGRTEEGDPWIGAEDPVLTIVEYSDYQCFYCRKAHLLLRSLLQRFPDKIRIVHRHFPLDKACNPAVPNDYHPGSCTMAVWAICADKQGAFWRMHDQLFALDRRRKNIELQELSKKLGLEYGSLSSCLQDASVLQKLARDIQSGLSHGVDSTPSYLVDGVLYKGKIPKEVLAAKLGPLE
jgi:protein-disulfide isomerase/uncharacterized membrane protein